MNYKVINPCSRCGKERIEVRTWTEEIDTFMGKSMITHTETACPDPECQALVEQKNDALKQKKDQMQHDRDERMKKAQEARKRVPKV